MFYGYNPAYFLAFLFVLYLPVARFTAKALRGIWTGGTLPSVTPPYSANSFRGLEWPHS